MSTFEWPVSLRFLVALGLGFLVGLERESARIEFKRLVFGGVRTFPILSMYGFGCAWVYQQGVQLMLPAGIVSVAVLAALSYIEKMKTGRFGVTSELSALLTFVVGAIALLADVRVAMALGVINTLLLSSKATLESYVERLDKSEFLATLKFLLVTFIIFPALPDREFTDYHINPARVWRIVIMVSSVGFAGYFLVKRFGARVGLWLAGLMGGVVSSTAVSVATGRMAQARPERADGALQATLLASSVMYLRILALIAVVNAALVPVLWWKLSALALVGVLLAVWPRHGRDSTATDEPPALSNPFEIRAALVFAILFMALTVVTSLVRSRFGTTGLFTLAGIVGIVDVDPFILSVAQHSDGGHVLATQAMLVAMMANTVMKGLYFSVLARPVRAAAATRYAAWALLHLPVILL